MKTLFALFVLSAFPVSSAHALPEGMSQSLIEAKQAYAEFSKKGADELRERQFDEIGFLANLGLGGMFEAVQSNDEVLEYHLQTVKDLAWTFKPSQLEALLDATREASPQFNSDSGSVQRDVTMLELALQYKKSKLNDSSLKEAVQKLMPKPSES
jgi:hypothetical protein